MSVEPAHKPGVATMPVPVSQLERPAHAKKFAASTTAR